MTIYILKRSDIDGSSVQDKWLERPTAEQLSDFLSAYHEEQILIDRIVKDLLKHGVADVYDSNRTTYELETI